MIHHTKTFQRAARPMLWSISLMTCMRLLSGTQGLAATPMQMQAIVQSGTGGPEVLHLRTVPVREPAAGQVLIHVYAAAVNPTDWKMRGGMGPGGSAEKIPGLDVAGRVEKLGSGVTGVTVGEPVFSMIGMSIDGLNGGYAQYALAPAANVIAKPKALTYAQAAGLATAGMIAERSVEQANIQAGQRVLITGVAGGVGSSTAQIAKARGAYVIGTASARHDAYLKSIGVDEVIDYTQGNFADKVKNIDVVIDTVGADTAEAALTTLKHGGTFVTIAARGFEPKCVAAGMNCPGEGPRGVGEGAWLQTAAQLAAQGKLAVNVDKVFPLASAADAQEFNRIGHTEGKVILAVDAAKAEIR